MVLPLGQQKEHLPISQLAVVVDVKICVVMETAGGLFFLTVIITEEGQRKKGKKNKNTTR